MKNKQKVEEGGAAKILTERVRQVVGEGYTSVKDDKRTDQSLAAAAVFLAAPRNGKFCGIAYGEMAPEFSHKLAAQYHGDRIRELAVAGALIAAEIDRLQRAGSK